MRTHEPSRFSLTSIIITAATFVAVSIADLPAQELRTAAGKSAVKGRDVLIFSSADTASTADLQNAVDMQNAHKSLGQSTAIAALTADQSLTQKQAVHEYVVSPKTDTVFGFSTKSPSGSWYSRLLDTHSWPQSNSDLSPYRDDAPVGMMGGLLSYHGSIMG